MAMYLALVFSATLFLSATLLFVVQPMVGKMILPTYGGTPAVWNTCMLFFQAILLAGYAYAHGAVVWLGVRRQAAVHVAVLLLPLLALPISLAADASPPGESDPVSWLLWHLLLTLGPLLFVVSSTAPLLQKWFSQTRHPAARDPYFLYAASNLGSLVALVGYPWLIERYSTLAQQGRYWAAGYAALVSMVVGCAVLLWRSAPSAEAHPGDATGNGRADRIGMALRARWVILAWVPSSLLLGVTTYITTNIAAVPLLWVIPLGLYLITFILVFARRTVLPHRWVLALFPYLVLSLGALTFLDSPDLSWSVIPPHLVLFFGIAMMCHGELARRRPATRHLTEFYLWISVGGVLGGLTNAVAAPFLFDSIVEYPLMLVLSCFLLPRRQAGSHRQRWLDLVYPAGMAVALVAVAMVLTNVATLSTQARVAMLIVGGAVTCFLFKDRPLRFGLGMAAFLAVVAHNTGADAERLQLVERNFYGVKRVVDDEDGRFRRFVHGTTNHGMQWLHPVHRLEPTAYYHRSGPMGDIFTALGEMGLPHETAIIGLGAGGLACYAEPGQRFTFFEIDPAVERIARNPDYFTFLADCPGTYDVVLGDGRLTLARTPDAGHDLIVLDAFSSDAVPTHLLTREAVQLYVRKLRADGMLVFNITNAYLDFEPVMGNLARELGLVGRHRDDGKIGHRAAGGGWMASHYVVMARNTEGLGSLAYNPRWQPLKAAPDMPLWTDQFCGILGLLRRPHRPAAP